MTVITMSRKELRHLEALINLAEGRSTAAQAAVLIGVGERQVFRLLRAYRARGAEGLTHGAADHPTGSQGIMPRLRTQAT